MRSALYSASARRSLVPATTSIMRVTQNYTHLADGPGSCGASTRKTRATSRTATRFAGETVVGWEVAGVDFTRWLETREILSAWARCPGESRSPNASG